MNEAQMVQRLREWAGQFPTVKAAAVEIGISPQYLVDIVKGNRAVSDAVAAKLGYRRVVTFVPNPPQEGNS